MSSDAAVKDLREFLVAWTVAYIHVHKCKAIVWSTTSYIQCYLA